VTFWTSPHRGGNVCHEVKPVQLEDLLKSITDFMGSGPKQNQTLSCIAPKKAAVLNADPGP
jgi:hypothetical protein